MVGERVACQNRMPSLKKHVQLIEILGIQMMGEP